MRRACFVLTVAAVIAGGAPPARAATAVPDRVFIVWDEGIGADYIANGVHEYLARDGSAALVSLGVSPGFVGDPLAVAATLGSGTRERGDLRVYASALRRGLELAGMSVSAVVRLGREGIARAAMGDDVALRTARGPQELASMRFEPGEAVFIDLGGLPTSFGLDTVATRDDLVVGLWGVPDAERFERAGVRLSVASFWGAGFPRGGVLSSPTTRRKGIIALTDIAPTILAAVDPLAAGSFEGRPARAHAVGSGTDAIGGGSPLIRLEHSLVGARVTRKRVTRTFLYAAMLLVALAIALRGRGARALTVGALAVMSLPIVGFLSPFSPGGNHMRALVVTVVAVTVGLTAAALGARRGCIAIATLTAVIPLVDLVLGSPIGHRSPWGLTLATGGRFYGASEDTLGFVLGGSLIAAALVLERHRGWLLGVVIALATATAVVAAPSLGAKFGAIPTLVPAFGVLAVRALDRQVTLRVAAAIALATVVATGGSVLADRLRPQEQRSHIARAVGGDVNVGDLIARKWKANADITFTRAWTPAALVAGAGFVVLLRRRRLQEGLRRAAPAVAVGALTAMAANDGGVVTAALLLALATSAAIATARRDPAPNVEVPPQD